MNIAQIARQRLSNQGLLTAPFAAAEDVVAWLGAVQSQEYGLAKAAVAQRCTGITEADVDRAVADGVILRTHVLRPTWHFVH
ncbi:MAG: DNA glycosylase AlkZ-like family protein, partial [Longimicrobiales bacterium]